MASPHASNGSAAPHLPNAAPHPANVEIAIAFVVESSLTVAGDWTRLLADYVSPMLRRLFESIPTPKRRLAFITYATADTVPSPLLCKRFFLDSQPVTTEMRDSPASLGIGSTNSGGSRGMAALEGLVAAIELFEVFTSVVGRGRLVSRHIIHIASAAPDSSVHPRFNDSPKYDDMTWDSMADEMRNKNINFNTINLVPNLKRFAELHAKASAQASKDALKPFFSIRPPHSVLLAGIPSSIQQKPPVPAPAPAPAAAPTAPTKRAGDVHSTPDPKRARLAPPMDVSPPKPQTPNTPSNSNHTKPSPLLAAQPKVQPRTPVLPPAPAPALAPSMPMPVPVPMPLPSFPQAPAAAATAPQPQPQPQPQQPQPQPTMPLSKGNFLNGMKNLEMQIHALRVSIQNAQTAGDAAMVQTLTQEMNKKMGMQQRARDFMLAQLRNQNQNVNLNQNANAGGSQEGPSVNVQPGMSPPQPPMDQQQQQQQQQQALATMLHKRTASGSSAQGLMSPQANAGLVAQMQQMQKMAEQQQQQRVRSLHQQQQQQQQQGMPGPSSASATASVAAPQQQPPAKATHSIWQGSLVFSGTDAQGIKKDTVIWVLGRVQSPPEDSRIDTWPPTMQLSLAGKPAVPTPDLQAWIQTNRATLCLFQPQTNGIPDPVGNQANYKSLIAFLHERNGYAVSAWTLPSGEQGNNILFFPVKSDGLAAACFPLTGLPELPVPAPVPSRRPGGMPNFLNVDFSKPEARAWVQSLTQEQREQLGKAVKLQRVMQMQQQQGMSMAQGVGAQSAGGSASGSAMGVGVGVNAMGLQQQQQVQAQQQAQQQIPEPSFGNVHATNYGGMGMMNAMGLGVAQQPQPQPQPQTMMRPGGMRNAMPANINYEMMQSFMTRNPDGGGGMGQ